MLDSKKPSVQAVENDAQRPKKQGRIDPVLKLYPGCPVMLTENVNVPSGLANGTKARIYSIIMKPGETANEASMAETGAKVNVV